MISEKRLREITPLQAVRKVDLSANVLECIRYVIEKHDAALLEVMVEEIQKAKREAYEAALRSLPERGVGHYLYEKALTDCAAAIRALIGRDDTPAT